ncbi:MAG TPA: AMP-binding protein [Pseudonocardia sp.]|nr:AMP-binding protein [Pseudonocardia sp.]
MSHGGARVGSELLGRPLLPDLVFRLAQATPDRTALTSVGQGSATWGQVHSASRAWGRWLLASGVAPGDHVASLVPQSLEATYLWLGCAGIGAVEASINVEFRGDWLRHALSSSGARVVVIANRFLEHVNRVVEGSGITTILVVDGPATASEHASVQGVDVVFSAPEPAEAGGCGDQGGLGDPPAVVSADTACILYTSGTTGPSKPVEVPWGLLHSLCLTDPPFDRPEEQVLYVPYAPYHLSGRPAIYRAALAGARVVVRESFSAREFWSDVREHGCTWTLLYAAPARFLANNPRRPDDADNPLTRALMCPILPETDDLKDRFGFEAYSVYGMTEIGSPLVTGLQDSRSSNAGLCGEPVPWIQARLVDALDYPVRDGEVGELVLRSAQPWVLTPGYPGAPESTARAWRNGWFHTGDLMRRDDRGRYHYVDRTKDMIRRRGENISSVELESAVATHPGVREVAAVGVPSEFGDEDVLIAVVTSGDSTFSPAALVEYLIPRVPRYAIPRFIRVLTELPRTQSTNRVRKPEIRRAGLTPDTWDRLAP